MDDGIRWRPGIDAVEIELPDHGGACLIHRLAFRALIADASPAACLAFAAAHRDACIAAARAKIARDGTPPGRNLNINSRDIRRALGRA